MAQRGAKVGGWDVRSHDEIPHLTHYQLESQHVRAARRHFVNLVEFVFPPEEGDPSLTGTDGIGGSDVVTAQISSVHAVSDLGLREDSQIHPRCGHCPQSTL